MFLCWIDHILSYFLGGDALLPVNEEPGFTSGRSSYLKSTKTSRDDDSDMLHLPPTPVVQFYSNDSRRASQQYRGCKSIDGSSSGREDAKMNDAVNSYMGLPMAYRDNHSLKSDSLHTQQNHDYEEMYSRKENRSADLQSTAINNYSSENPSPISPAAMMNMNENLLLPYPSPGSGGINVDATKVTIVSSNTDMQNVDNVADTQVTTVESMAGIFDINHHETRFLPPEKLIEVFHPPGHAILRQANVGCEGLTNSLLQQGTNVVAFGSIINGTNEAVAMSHVNHSLSNQNGSIISNTTAAPYPQHFIYTHHPDVAAAILNRHHAFLNNPTPPVESEEKRAKRLERNRESARKSRRKKKERLLTSGTQVKKLQEEIEKERRKHINAIVPVMNRLRVEDIHILMRRLLSGEFTNEVLSDRTCIMIQESGPNSRIMRSVLDFQYTALKQVTLPNYQKLLLWFCLLDESFFAAGKDEYNKRVSTANTKATCKQPLRSSPAASAGKNVSSKQIGEELFNGYKEESSGKGKNTVDKDSDACDRPSVVSVAYDGSSTWPLLSFELRLSVDQEERFLFTHKQLRQKSLAKRDVIENNHGENLTSHLSQIAAACNTTDILSKAVGSLSHVISRREEISLARILKPEQLWNFQTWLLDSNSRSRCRNRINSTLGLNATMQACHISSIPQPTEMDCEVVSGIATKEASLQDICWRLNKILRISNV
jgi:hypothetical protein